MAHVPRLALLLATGPSESVVWAGRKTGRKMIQEWMWSPAGEIDCACCGASYQVMTSRGNRRRYDYCRCEICDTVIDEWVDTAERTHLRLTEPTKSVEERELALAEAG